MSHANGLGHELLPLLATTSVTDSRNDPDEKVAAMRKSLHCVALYCYSLRVRFATVYFVPPWDASCVARSETKIYRYCVSRLRIKSINL